MNIFKTYSQGIFVALALCLAPVGHTATAAEDAPSRSPVTKHKAPAAYIGLIELHWGMDTATLPEEDRAPLMATIKALQETHTPTDVDAMVAGAMNAKRCAIETGDGIVEADDLTWTGAGAEIPVFDAALAQQYLHTLGQALTDWRATPKGCVIHDENLLLFFDMFRDYYGDLQERRGALISFEDMLQRLYEGFVLEHQANVAFDAVDDAEAQRRIEDRQAEQAQRIKFVLKGPFFNSDTPEGHAFSAWAVHTLFTDFDGYIDYAEQAIDWVKAFTRFDLDTEAASQAAWTDILETVADYMLREIRLKHGQVNFEQSDLQIAYQEMVNADGDYTVDHSDIGTKLKEYLGLYEEEGEAAPAEGVPANPVQ